MTEEHDRPEPRSTDAADAAATPSDSGNDVADKIVAKLDAGVDRILQAFEEKLRYDASKQQIIDRLHDELAGHRADLVGQTVRPFIFGLLHHHAEVGKLHAAVRDASDTEVPSAKVCELLGSLQQDVEDVLAANGVSAFRAAVSEPFDPVRQTVVGKALPTQDEARAGTIAACISPGFERDGRILVKARVSAYRFEPPSPDS